MIANDLSILIVDTVSGGGLGGHNGFILKLLTICEKPAQLKAATVAKFSFLFGDYWLKGGGMPAFSFPDTGRDRPVFETSTSVQPMIESALTNNG